MPTKNHLADLKIKQLTSCLIFCVIAYEITHKAETKDANVDEGDQSTKREHTRSIVKSNGRHFPSKNELYYDNNREGHEIISSTL